MKNTAPRKVVLIFLALTIVISVLSSCSPERKKAEVPDKVQVKDAYRQAMEAYGWFDMTTMPVDYSVSKEYNGTKYYRVEHNDIETYADLKLHLQELFSDDIVLELLGQAKEFQRYTDIDGVLYAVQADRGADITKGEETHQIIYEANDRIIYRVEVEIIDFETMEVVDRETYDFTYENLNGKWVFSNFCMVR
jgi:hypothetical protein